MSKLLRNTKIPINWHILLGVSSTLWKIVIDDNKLSQADQNDVFEK